MFRSVRPDQAASSLDRTMPSFSGGPVVQSNVAPAARHATAPTSQIVNEIVAVVCITSRTNGAASSAIAQCAPQPFSERLHEPKTTAAESRWQRQLVRARLCGRIAQIQFGRASVLVSHYFVGKVRLVSLAPPNWSEQTFGQHVLKLRPRLRRAQDSVGQVARGMAKRRSNEHAAKGQSGCGYRSVGRDWLGDCSPVCG